MSNDLIIAENLTVGYRNIKAIRGVTFKLPQGATLVIGANGSGKSTLLKSIAGLLKPEEGYLKVMGFKPYNDISKAVISITYIAEHDALPYNVRVESVVEALLFTHSYNRIDEALEILGLKRHLKKRVGELSQGLRRRLALVEALASHKPLILLDEPYRGLDREGRMVVTRGLRSLLGRSSVIMASHIPPPLEFDHLLVLEDGKLAYSGPMHRLRDVCAILDCGERVEVCGEEVSRKIGEGCRLVELFCAEGLEFLPANKA